MMTNLPERKLQWSAQCPFIDIFVVVVEKRATFVPLESSVDGREGDVPSGAF